MKAGDVVRINTRFIGALELVGRTGTLHQGHGTSGEYDWEVSLRDYEGPAGAWLPVRADEVDLVSNIPLLDFSEV